MRNLKPSGQVVKWSSGQVQAIDAEGFSPGFIASHQPTPSGPEGLGVISPTPSLGHWATGPLPGGHFRGGFNMLEILLSMAIFAIGFVMVAAIFPSAIFMQKQTGDDIAAKTMEESLTTLLQTRPFVLTSLEKASGPYNPSDGLIPPNMLIVRPVSLLIDDVDNNDFWLLADRTLESHIPDPSMRRYVWVPLIRRTRAADAAKPSDGDDFVTYVFVLRVDPGMWHLRPTAAPLFQAGEQWAIRPFFSGNNVNPNDGFNDINGNGNVDLGSPNLEHYRTPSVRSVGVTVSGSDTFNFRTGFVNTNQIRVGDWVLDANGQKYQIREAEDDKVKVQGSIIRPPGMGPPGYLWYAPPPVTRESAQSSPNTPTYAGTPSPTLRILTVPRTVRNP